MAKTSKAQSALAYLPRVLEDEFVQEQIRNAMSGARGAYARTRRQKAQVVQDKGLYANLRQAATSLQNVGNALRKPPEPEPKHRGRRLMMLAVAIGATAFVTARLQKQYSRQASRKSTPMRPAESPGTAAGGPETLPAQPAGAEVRA